MSAAHLDENRRLREAYAAHGGASLSDEQRARAEALAQRDERKRAKKDLGRKAKEMKRAFYERARTAWRSQRKAKVDAARGVAKSGPG